MHEKLGGRHDDNHKNWAHDCFLNWNVSLFLRRSNVGRDKCSIHEEDGVSSPHKIGERDAWLVVVQLCLARSTCNVMGSEVEQSTLRARKTNSV